jgi:diadenosine tetraphosphate (Ap4A) HIT family hydrolase
MVRIARTIRRSYPRGVKRLGTDEAFALLRDERRSDECTMCAIARAPVIAETRHASCVLDRFAARRGHMLVVAKRHVERVSDLAWEEWCDAQRIAWEACAALERALAPARVYVAALGAPRASERTFPHVHVHVVPLADGGEADRPSEVFTWKNGVLVFEPGEERALADELRAAWPR